MAPYFFFGLLGLCVLMIIGGAVYDAMPKRAAKPKKGTLDAEDASTAEAEVGAVAVAAPAAAEEGMFGAATDESAPMFGAVAEEGVPTEFGGFADAGFAEPAAPDFTATPEAETPDFTATPESEAPDFTATPEAEAVEPEFSFGEPVENLDDFSFGDDFQLPGEEQNKQ